MLADTAQGFNVCKLVTPDDFEDLDEFADQILVLENDYNVVARPFDWKFTRTDLNQLLTRIRKHDRHAPQPMAVRHPTN